MNKKQSLAGIIPIIAVPFTQSGAVDEDSFQALIRHLLHTGATGLTLFGLASEFYKLTDAERSRLQSLLLEETRDSTVAGIISITDHSWEMAVPHAQAAEAEGADALMLLPPFFLGPSEDAILAHVRKVVASVRIPVIIQYAPAQTGVRLSPDLFLQLRDELPNADYVKVEAQPPGPYVTQLRERSGGSLGTLVGYAGVQMPDALLRGAAGVQPGCSYTEVYVAIYECFQIGDIAGMYALHGALLPYIAYWMQSLELIVAAEKTVLQRRGIIATDYCRHPAYQFDSIENARFDAFLEEFRSYLGSPASG
jgi:4-hydroxy-tetrahydrodipicolinate synthase